MFLVRPLRVSRCLSYDDLQSCEAVDPAQRESHRNIKRADGVYEVRSVFIVESDTKHTNNSVGVDFGNRLIVIWMEPFDSVYKALQGIDLVSWI